MAFLGMRGTGDWVTDQRPKSWREVILYRYPNGSAPLTAMLSKMASERTTDPEFNWWVKPFAAQTGAITGVYTEATLTTAYSTGGTAADTLYIKMSAADLTTFRIGHVVQLRLSTDLSLDCVGKITARVASGASSYVAVYLLEDDDNSSVHDLSDAKIISVIGNANAEGADMPDAITHDPVKWYNFTQIWRTPLEMTRTAMQTRLRTGEQYKEAKREALEIHSVEMEKSCLFSVPSELTGSNGKPERTTLGIIPAIRGGYTGMGDTTGGIVNNYVTDTNHKSETWAVGGEDWLDDRMEEVFRYGSSEKLALAGSGAILAINKLIKAGGNFDYTSATVDYGIKVTKWTTAAGVLNVLSHPLLSLEETTRNAMVIIEPKDLKYRFIQDTMYKADEQMKKGGYLSRDGIKEEYLTEAGLEFHHPDGAAFLYGFGQTNTAT